MNTNPEPFLVTIREALSHDVQKPVVAAKLQAAVAKAKGESK